MRRIALLLLLTIAPLATAADLLDKLLAVRNFHQAAISPDGKQVGWSVREGGLWVEGKELAKGDVPTFAFSPDSKRVAWFAKRKLYVDGREVGSVKGSPDALRWSPDGKRVAFLLFESSREAGALVATARKIGVIADAVEQQRVVVADVSTGAMKPVTAAGMYIYEFDWSPDGARLVTTSSPGSGTNNWWIAQLHVADIASGTMQPIYKPALQITWPRWSPDGKRIAFIEGLMSDFGSNGGDLFVIDAAGGAPRNLTKDARLSVASMQWSGNDALTVGANVEGDAAILRVTESGQETLWRGAEFISAEAVIGASFGANGRTAVIRSSFGHPPEIWRGSLGKWTQVTHLNDAIKIESETKSVRWKSDDFDVQGWLQLPADYSPSKRYPMIVWVHGGPASASLNKWPRDEPIVLSQRGYFVFWPNPRGSFGFGEAFTRANVKDFGYGDLRDIERGVDAVLQAYPIDPRRVGIAGWSYGGYMTMWAVTQTDRFRAAVAGAGIVNWQSYYGQNDIDQWMLPYFGATVYDEPAVYARSSPITFIKKAKTPTLVLAGERDAEVPAPQSFEFWHALKEQGVETQLVVFADEGHRISKPAHKRELARRIMDWFDARLR
ncbi:MAG TPA: S9 family peptidase [Thermoanaerobaculia bacterium]|nr:S9 family peptidase [Thermoanaerobaculia bacterium]